MNNPSQKQSLRPATILFFSFLLSLPLPDLASTLLSIFSLTHFAGEVDFFQIFPFCSIKAWAFQMIPVAASTFLLIATLNPLSAGNQFSTYAFLLLLALYCNWDSPACLCVLIAFSLLGFVHVGSNLVQFGFLLQVVEDISLQVEWVEEGSLCQWFYILGVDCPDRKCVVTALDHLWVLRNRWNCSVLRCY